MRSDWDTYFLEIARAVAKRSTCPRLNVGCVITLNNKILTTGYNGSSPGEKHCDEVGCHIVDNHCKRTIHAETNALNQLQQTSDRMVIYVTHEPCDLCRIQITRHQIKSIVYGTTYNSETNVWRYDHNGFRES
jgi:dCMP deaminase